jgi:hypothetical protein
VGAKGNDQKNRDIKIARAFFVFCFLGTVLASAFQIQLFPFSYYPMFSSQKPIPPERQNVFPLAKGDLWGKERYLVLFGVTKEKKEFRISYQGTLWPYDRDFFWWLSFNAGLTREGAREVLKQILESRVPSNPEDDSVYVGLKLYDFKLSFAKLLENRKKNIWLDSPSDGEMKLIAEYFAPPEFE